MLDLTPGADVVVVLSFHGRDDTIECVESLVNGSPEAAVLVIDNGSFDGVLEAVRDRWPDVGILQTGRNLGFSGGMNAGLRWALGRDARSVTVLNNDTTVPPGAIAALVARVCRGLVLVSPEVRYAGDRGRVWFGGGVIDRDSCLPRHLTPDELDAQPVGDAGTRTSQILAGCCLTASADTWRQLGLFDDRFFLTFEDSELSVRATRRGVELVVDTAVVIHHKVSASFVGAYAYLGLFYYARNGLLFGALHRPRDVLARIRFLRRHVVGQVAEPLRQKSLAEAVRRTMIIALAVLFHLLRRYGEAPEWLTVRARRWAGRSQTVAPT